MRTALMLSMILAGSVAHAGNNELSVTTTVRALRSDSANALTESSLGGSAFAYERALGISPVPELELWATGSFGWGVATGTMFQTLTTSIDTVAFTAGGRARYALRRWAGATARLDVGTTRASVALEDGMGHSAADHGWGGTLQGALGVELTALRGRAMTLGLRLELGYVVASSVELVATPQETDDSTLQLEMSAARLGSIDLSGPMFSFALTSQF